MGWSSNDDDDKDKSSDKNSESNARQQKGGIGEVMSGYDSDYNPILVAFGYGTREGDTYLSSNPDLTPEEFRQSENHDHYGPGNGPNNNGTQRGAYTGPGSK